MRAVVLAVLAIVAFALMSDLGRLILEVLLAVSISFAAALVFMLWFRSRAEEIRGDRERQAKPQPREGSSEAD